MRGVAPVIGSELFNHVSIDKIISWKIYKLSNRIATVYCLCKIFFWKRVMGVDRRQSDSRRDGGGAGDRRQKSDRRAVSGRREVDAPGKSSAASSAPARKAAKSAKNRKMPVIIKKIAIAVIVFAVLFAAGMVLFFANLDFLMEKVGDRVKISIDRALLDPQSLTGKITRARLNFRVKNTLPLGVVFQNLTFDVKISEYTVAKGMQAAPKITVEGGSETVVPIACNVDSIMTRRALQKTIERNAGPLLKNLLTMASGKADTLGDDIKALIKIKGTAEFRLKAGGAEIPFTRKLNF